MKKDKEEIITPEEATKLMKSGAVLTSKQIIEESIITNWSEDGVAQVGIDLHVIKINKIKDDSIGFIPAVGKTVLPVYESVPLLDTVVDVDGKEVEQKIWILKPGMYEVIFQEGCNIPTNCMLELYQRSSLMRNGGLVRSAVFDPGFKTDSIGSWMYLTHPVKIEYGARICQAVTTRTEQEAEAYNGQWQNDKQRTNGVEVIQ